MLRLGQRLGKTLLTRTAYCASEGDGFLQMVDQYFDKAGKHTDIRPDILNFYKRADNVVKFNLTLLRGTYHLI